MIPAYLGVVVALVPRRSESRLSFLVVAFFFLLPLLAAPALAKVPKPEEYINRHAPGVFDGCSLRLSPDEADEALESNHLYKMHKINDAWYAFLPKEVLKMAEISLIWSTLIAKVGAIQSLYGKRADFYLCLTPTRAEYSLMRKGQTPRHLIIAEALYQWEATIRQGKSCPKGFHKIVYRYIVHDPNKVLEKPKVMQPPEAKKQAPDNKA